MAYASADSFPGGSERMAHTVSMNRELKKVFDIFL